MAGKMQKIEIIYEDDAVCVCKKPPGLACEHKKASEVDLVKALKRQSFLQAPEQGEPQFFLVHRLDQPVGGIMVLAKNQEMAARLSEQIRNHSFVKHYLAVVMAEKESVKITGHLENYLVQNGHTNTSVITDKQEKKAKKAELDYELLAWSENKNRALVKVVLKTGRHHQIRVQLAGCKMPLVNDQKYNPYYQEIKADGNVALYAFHLEFIHPKTGNMMKFTEIPTHSPFEEWEKSEISRRVGKF